MKAVALGLLKCSLSQYDQGFGFVYVSSKHITSIHDFLAAADMLKC